MNTIRVSETSLRNTTRVSNSWNRIQSKKDGKDQEINTIKYHTCPRIPHGKVTKSQLDTGLASSIPVGSHTFVEIDHEMISTVILLPSADSFKKGCCQLQAKVCAQITG